MDQPTCEQRIAAELQGRITQIKEAQDDDQKREEFQESILALQKFITFKVELSWGGPQDFFTIQVDDETHEIVEIRYSFLDWFDGAERHLSGPDFDTVAAMFDYLTDI